MRLAAPPAPEARARDAARELEATLLRQLLASSGAFKGGDGAGDGVRSDLFVSALADAVARAGGIGLADVLARSMTGAAGGAAAAPAPASLAPASPVPGRAPSPALDALPLAGSVTSAFGTRRDPFTGAAREHDGLDVAAPEGAPIHAAAAGVVRSAGPRGGYGNAVEIDHGGGVVTLYGHASEVLVAPGQAVRPGDAIARVGSTGRSTGPHLHFEVRVGGRPVDPARALKIYASRADDVSRSGP